jgi:hypothetical protein
MQYTVISDFLGNWLFVIGQEVVPLPITHYPTNCILPK